MASRHIAQQQNGGEAVVGANKQKIMGAEKKNRLPLGDIGNLHRPVTRSFCAQLLANAQNAAAGNNKNANGVVLLDGALPEKRAVARKPVVRKKATIKPRPEEIIEISPDTVEKISEKEKAGEKLSKKKAPTLTSVLTARSKAACGLSNKPKTQIVDIDADDVNKELAVVEYVEDMYKYYKSAENEGWAHNYIDSQPEISDKMRAILIDWLVQVHGKFELSPETLYLTVNIVDRYLASTTTTRRELQLVGVSSMLIASKYEEIWAPEVQEFADISDKAYTNKQILIMEKQILGQLEWTLTVPTPYVFLVRFIKASLTDLNVENMVFFLAELGMMHHATSMYCPSMIAASAVYAARCTFNKTPFWNETLKLHTGFSESQLMDCAKLLVSFHSVAAEKNKCMGIFRKYSSSERGEVSLLPPAKSLLVFTLSNYSL